MKRESRGAISIPEKSTQIGEVSEEVNSQSGSESSSLNDRRVLSQGCRGHRESKEGEGETHDVGVGWRWSAGGMGSGGGGGGWW